MPAFHAAMLHSPDEDRAVLNLGGIANFTLLPARGDVRGFDTGPANALMDAWCERHRGVPFDAGGAFAASGQVDAELLLRLLDEPWFMLPPPKSTGREQFQLDWVQARLRGDEVTESTMSSAHRDGSRPWPRASTNTPGDVNSLRSTPGRSTCGSVSRSRKSTGSWTSSSVTLPDDHRA